MCVPLISFSVVTEKGQGLKNVLSPRKWDLGIENTILGAFYHNAGCQCWLFIIFDLGRLRISGHELNH